ncbi:zinc finger and BTB domain-containing protein 41 isoform X2 [Esox lucius]|nr:zinc finger and BTB domain-containing protein 41 isoform X2 [Esox lucius]
MKRKSSQPQPHKTRGGVSVSAHDPTAMTDSKTAPLSQVPRPNRHLTMTKHGDDLLKFLNEDRTERRFCDVSVTVGGKRYSAHKAVLAHGSSYFHAELTKNRAADHISLDHVEDSVFQHLLCFLYTSKCVIPESEVPALSAAARFLDVMDVVRLLAGDEDGPAVRPRPEVKPAVDPNGEEVHEASDPPAACAGIQNPAQAGAHRCSFCGRAFRYKKSLENHLARSHSDTSQVDPRRTEEVVSPEVVTTSRRSARRRRAPAKLERDVTGTNKGKSHHHLAGGGPNAAEEDHDEEEEGNPKPTTDKGNALAQTEREDEEGEEDEQGGGLMRGAGENPESSELETAEPQAADEVEVCCQAASEVEVCCQQANEVEDGCQAANEVVCSQSADGSQHVSVYPEELVPVIVQSSSKKTLKCPKCDKTFDRIGKYESHTTVHTGEKPFQCDVCLQCYSTKSNLTVHKKKHAGDAPFQVKDHKCPFCSKLHASKKTLAKHVRRFHPDHIQEFLAMRKKKSDGWKCDICHKSFTRRPHLEEHMILHTQNRPFKCTFCDDHFKSRFARLKHQEKYHLGPFPCDICGRQFNDTGNRKRHIECTHGGKRKWTCFICGKSVRERTTLKEHMRIHSGEKPHLCSICGQSFRHGSSYRLHLRVHHDDKRYECDECGKTFIRHDHLTKHQKIHSGEKAHQCEECGKCFRRHDHLTVHYKSVHLGEKVWQKYKTAVHQCEVCKKEFKGKSSLEMHFRTHSGEKPYRCPVCQQTFRIKKTLTKHMVIHSDARPFNCPHCSATFKRKDKLKYHTDHVHSAKYAEPPRAAATEDKAAALAYHDDGSSEVYRAEPKAVRRNVAADACAPVALVPVQMPGGDRGGRSTQAQTRGVLPVPAPPRGQGQQQPSGAYHTAAELAFLEKYTLTPQPANIVHPVRPDQLLDPRDQSYLGTLLGLDPATPVRNVSDSDRGAR